MIKDKIENVCDTIISQLKIIGEKEYNNGSYESLELMGKLDAFVLVLSAMGFSNTAIVEMYRDYGIDYKHILQ